MYFNVDTLEESVIKEGKYSLHLFIRHLAVLPRYRYHNGRVDLSKSALSSSRHRTSAPRRNNKKLLTPLDE